MDRGGVGRVAVWAGGAAFQGWGMGYLESHFSAGVRTGLGLILGLVLGQGCGLGRDGVSSARVWTGQRLTRDIEVCLYPCQGVVMV